jgi:hypothetical protein
MALLAKLQFGDNASRRYSREYLVTDFKCRVARSHNQARPDGSPHCERLEVTLVVPGKEDLNLYEWYSDRSAQSGRVLIELSTPAQNLDSEWKEVLFEDGVCFSMAEEYHIDRNRRREIRLSIAVGNLTIDRISF